MKDSIALATVAGLIGAAIMDFLNYLILFAGIPSIPSWYVAADVFLSLDQANSLLGTIIGLIGTLALGIATALLIVVLIKLTGNDYAILKGILTSNAVGFGAMGLFIPLLNITPQLQSQPHTNIIAMVLLTLTGGIIAYILSRYGQFLRN